MKLAIVHTDLRLYWPARLAGLQQYLFQYGIELIVLEIAGKGSPYSFAEHESESKPDYWQILFPDRGMEELHSAEIQKSLFDRLDRLQPDVILAGAIAFPSGALATAWAKKNKKKLIVFDDAKIDDVPRSGIVNFIKRQIYRCVDAVLYPSEDWKQTGGYWGFRKEQLFYGVDVVDNAYWQQPVAEKRMIEEKYFLSIGRLIPTKNFLFLLSAYNQYRNRVQDPYQLCIVGDGPDRELLENYISSNEIQGVHLISFKQQFELISIYRNAEAFVLASKFPETWGLVVNEAMASGLPVIVSDRCGCAKTLVKQGINGYLFSPDQEAELADRLLKFHRLSNKEKNNMKEASLHIIKDWDLDRFCKAVYDAIEYVRSRPFRKPSLVSEIILRIWKGRYRPV